MRVLVTGGSGFAGGWLVRDLASAGHEVRTDHPSGTRIDATDRFAVSALLDDSRPDLVVHLAAISFAPDAEADATRALRVNVGGTAILADAIRRLTPGPALIVVSSAEVYAPPLPGQGPIDEHATTVPSRVYGLSKLAQESVALAAAASDGLRLAIVRPFNHTGPGQRRVFAIPAFASRIIAARAAGVSVIPVGNVNVQRDIGDVRDTVRAYRLVGEALVEGRIETGKRFNVATGSPVRIGDVIDRLSDLAGHRVEIAVDASLVREDDPPLIVGDATLLQRVTGWSPEIPLDRTLGDVLADVEQHPG